MTLCVMFLNMLKHRRLVECRHIPIQIPHPLMDRRIPTPNIPDIALEVLHVDRIEADDRRVEPYIGLRDFVAEVERSRG